MKQLRFFLLSALAFLCQTTDMKAQDVKELVVVMNRNYTYQDPRWESSVVLKKGEAITVINEKGANYDYWPYPAANVAIPKKVTHVPGAAREHYIVLNGANIRLRKGPSLNHGYYCYNELSGASVYHNQFIKDNNKPKTDEWGLEASWKAYTLPKGTRLPYLGTEKGFYKTKFNGMVFYIQAKSCLLK